MPVPAEVLQLVARFEAQREAYLSGAYNETQLRREFLDPFFQALGWDVDNRQGYAEAYKDVVHEDAIKVGGVTKAPDYSFRIGGHRKFFVEAKRPSVNIKEDVDPAYQLRRYAWSAKLPLSILTDFEELAVYDCRIKPALGDKSSVARTLYLRYTDYAERWEELADIFSREAVLKGSFDKYAESGKRKRGTAEVDSAFLSEIESWRAELAKNLALRNAKLEQRELNFAVQRIIDRIIFLRICEDRGIESYGRLQGLVNGPHIYARLCDQFREADARYNSGLFHFRPERGRGEEPDELTLGLKLDDKALKETIESLYYPESPYEFSVLPADILGQVYEQFLGKVIRLTAGHQAKVEDKPEVKKAGGVYYTPTYIVDYIVKQTVGKLLEGRTPKQADALTVLDPACGSGSFLIGAYQFIMDWYRDQYAATPDKYRKQLYQGPGGAWRLTTPERKRILLNNIYGVDIDPQAVEVTKLSLLLKVLEGESSEAINHQFTMFHQRALPDLGNSIKCGNSLIGPDFYDGRQLDAFDEEERYRINAFDWQAEFPSVFERRDKGFDAVFGNPPWGASFSEEELNYLRDRFPQVVARMIDSFIYFIALASQVAVEGSPIGFIVPTTIINQVDARPVRELLLRRGVTDLISLGPGVFGRKVLNTSTVFVSTKQVATGSIRLAKLTVAVRELRKQLEQLGQDQKWSVWKGLVSKDSQLTFYVSDFGGPSLLTRLKRAHAPLSALISGSIERGVSPDVAEAHVVSKQEVREEKLESELIRSSVSGQEIKRYHRWKSDQFIIYTTRATDIASFPRALAHLQSHREKNTCKEVKAGRHPWWCLHRPRDPQIFESPKFIGLTTSKSIHLIYDPDRSVFVTDAMYVFRTKPSVDPLVLMGVLQSRAFLFLYRVANQGESRVIPQVKASKLQDLPVPSFDTGTGAITAELRARVEELSRIQELLDSPKTGQDRTALTRQAMMVDARIDALVYQLYRLTEAEIRLVEEATA